MNARGERTTIQRGACESHYPEEQGYWMSGLICRVTKYLSGMLTANPKHVEAEHDDLLLQVKKIAENQEYIEQKLLLNPADQQSGAGADRKLPSLSANEVCEPTVPNLTIIDDSSAPRELPGFDPYDKTTIIQKKPDLDD